MSTPRPTEADVEALAPIEECIAPADLMEAMVHAGAWAVVEATMDTADREPSRELYEQTVADVRTWLAARDAEHQREVEALRRWKAEASSLFDGLQDLGRALDLPLGALITGPAAVEAASALIARAEAAERDRDEARRELADLRARVAGLADEWERSTRGIEEPDDWYGAHVRALLPTEDDQ